MLIVHAEVKDNRTQNMTNLTCPQLIIWANWLMDQQHRNYTHDQSGLSRLLNEYANCITPKLAERIIGSKNATGIIKNLTCQTTNLLLTKLTLNQIAKHAPIRISQHRGNTQTAAHSELQTMCNQVLEAQYSMMTTLIDHWINWTQQYPHLQSHPKTIAILQETLSELVLKMPGYWPPIDIDYAELTECYLTELRTFSFLPRFAMITEYRIQAGFLAVTAPESVNAYMKQYIGCDLDLWLNTIGENPENLLSSLRVLCH